VRLVIDASVAVKWFLHEPHAEADSDVAAALLLALRSGKAEAVQPVHWPLEVAAVMARREPERCEAAVALLDALDLEVADGAEVLLRAARMAADLDAHLFDTLYHAVALSRGAVLVTADRRYFNGAAALGSVELLDRWSPGAS
jgi:predicted nucleic acid-binding protein